MIEISDRMMQYERCGSSQLPNLLPTVVRIDGKKFSSYTNGMYKPFDYHLSEAFRSVSVRMLNQIPGAILGFQISDEITFVILNSEEMPPYCGNLVDRINSVTASRASAEMVRHWLAPNDKVLKKLDTMTPEQRRVYTSGSPAFSSRCFVLPNIVEVAHYLGWRQAMGYRQAFREWAQKILGPQHDDIMSGIRTTADGVSQILTQADKDFDAVFSQYRMGRVFVQETFEHEGDKFRKWRFLEETPWFLDDPNVYEDTFYSLLCNAAGVQYERFIPENLRNDPLPEMKYDLHDDLEEEDEVMEGMTM